MAKKTNTKKTIKLTKQFIDDPIIPYTCEEPVAGVIKQVIDRIEALEQRVTRIVTAIDKSKSVRDL